MEISKSFPIEVIESSATAIFFLDNPRLAYNILSFIDRSLRSRRMLVDFGCGYGVLTHLFREALGFEDAVCVEIDEERARHAESLGLKVIRVDLEKEQLPLPKYVDLVIMAGILNHLKFWDNPLSEASRLLRAGGLLFISNPNMGWWANRIALLLSYQPADVEISERYACGLPPFYPRKASIQYVHSATLRGLKHILALYGFKDLKVWPARIPSLDLRRKLTNPFLAAVIRSVDLVLGSFPSFGIRTFLLAEKVAEKV